MPDSLRKNTLLARRTWNAAAHQSRERAEYDAAMELLLAARNVVRLLKSYELDEPNDDDVEAGFGSNDRD